MIIFSHRCVETSNSALFTHNKKYRLKSALYSYTIPPIIGKSKNRQILRLKISFTFLSLNKYGKLTRPRKILSQAFSDCFQIFPLYFRKPEYVYGSFCPSKSLNIILDWCPAQTNTLGGISPVPKSAPVSKSPHT